MRTSLELHTKILSETFLNYFDMLSLNMSFICLVNVEIFIFRILICICDDMCENVGTARFGGIELGAQSMSRHVLGQTE